MKIISKFEIGDEVWAYDHIIFKAKIVHINVRVNGEEDISYELNRDDKYYKDYYDYDKHYLYAYKYGSEQYPRTSFEEEELGSSKWEVKKILVLEERERYNKKLDMIEDL